MPFLIANWKIVLIGLLVILLGWSRITIANLEAENTKLAYELQSWKDAFSNLKLSTDKCNNSVTEYETRSKTAQSKAQESIKKYEAKALHQEKLISAINARNVANRDNRSCEQAVIDSKGDLL